MSIDLAEVRGVPECTLSPSILDVLPDRVAPAPWRAHASGVFWWKRPDDEAIAALREVLPSGIDPTLTPARVTCAMISYEDTPVGKYREILAIVTLRRGIKIVSHIPFIAVDSAASVVGGRANWALPKTLIEFDGWPGSGTTMSAMGAGWTVSASPTATGPRLPFVTPRANAPVQFGPDDAMWKSKVSGRGLIRRASVEVTATSTGSLASWLPTGRCRGAVALSMHGWAGPSTIAPARAR